MHRCYITRNHNETLQHQHLPPIVSPKLIAAYVYGRSSPASPFIKTLTLTAVGPPHTSTADLLSRRPSRCVDLHRASNALASPIDVDFTKSRPSSKVENDVAGDQTRSASSSCVELAERFKR